MFRVQNFFIKFFLVLVIVSFTYKNVYSEESDVTKVLQQLKKLQGDIETLEKAVYSNSAADQSTISLNSEGEDVLTRHLLKLNEIEQQFHSLTNKFEEINFKIDKLSNRITKIQSDNQLRFQDLERGKVSLSDAATEQKKLPGSDEAQDLGSISDSDVASVEQIQETRSIQTTGTVTTEKTTRSEKILPDVSPNEQYKFAISFLKVGDYETAEKALREFVDTNGNHELAGNAQYWYGETFRIRQLYVDAATAYLNGYQKYPQSNKAPINLLKLGVTLVHIGEKEQGCSMIEGVSTQYPEANQSIIQKAEYEKKRFKCGKKS